MGRVRCFCLIVLGLWFVRLQAQQISGRVTDNDGVPQMHVLCKLLNEGDSILCYTLSSQEGVYSLPYRQGGCCLRFSRLSLKDSVVALKPDLWKYDVCLQPQTQHLNLVTVKADPVVQRGDTIRYNVEALRQKGDEHIEDVLRRIPGVEVDGDGRITYQGKSINKLNIEGMDLMGNQYNLATRNMPADAVAQIQVLERNQPIRALEGRVRSNRATLNLKLKKSYHLRPFGEAEAGGGASPALWDALGNVMQVGSKNQAFLTATSNNRGVSLESLTRSMSNHDAMYIYEPLPQPLARPSTAATPPLSSLYHLHNRSHLVGLNFLHAFSPISTLRTHLLFHRQDLVLNDSSSHRFVAGDTIDIFENNRLRYRSRNVRGGLRYELNHKRLYLEECLSASFDPRRTRNTIRSNRGILDEYSQNLPYEVKNALVAHLNTSHGLYTLSSVVRAFQGREQLTVYPYAGDSVRHPYRQQQWFMRHRVGTSISLGPHPLSLAYIMEYKQQRTCGLHGDYSQRTRYGLHTLEPSYEMDFEWGDLTLLVPVEYLLVRNSKSSSSWRRVMCSPRLDISRKFSSLFSLDAELFYNQRAATQHIPMRGFLWQNYRTISHQLDSLSLDRVTQAALTISWLDPTVFFSWNLYVGYTHTLADHHMARLYADNFTIEYPVWTPHKRDAWSAAFLVKKVLMKSGLSVSYKVMHAFNKAFVEQNDMDGYIRYQAHNQNLTLEWDKWKWLKASVQLAGNLTWKARDAFSSTRNLLRSGYYAVRLDFHPAARWTCTADFAQSCIEVSPRHYAQDGFFNAGVKWQILSTLALRLDAINLLNRKVYEELVYTGSNVAYSRMPLRGREVLCTLKWHF